VPGRTQDLADALASRIRLRVADDVRRLLVVGSDDLSRWMSAGPAAFLGLHGRKGAIARDHDADLVVWDPEERFTVVAEMIHHRHKVTPYEGKNLYGKVRATFLRGEKVFHDGKFGRPMGRLLTRSYSAEQV
ncbi:MAG: amidohydrolase family protein, partial [Ignavibacteriae bacterium]|nr:amidohydrolase family protein [Ignavibacteriota bacterium]